MNSLHIFLLASALLSLCACAANSSGEEKSGDDPWSAQRRAMVDNQLKRRDIVDPAVLAAMAKIPRHLFVPEQYRAQAYQDRPLPIGHAQTISQPYIVALMTQYARASPGKKALDVGTGSGYQAAVLGEIVDEVYSIEILCRLADEARARLDGLGYENITVRCGDGYAGWPEEAPFDLIVVAAAPEQVPQPLIDQIAPGGFMVIPVGAGSQELVVMERREDGTIRRQTSGGVRFVPMTGRAQEAEPDSEADEPSERPPR